jgi:hypothetical protein
VTLIDVLPDDVLLEIFDLYVDEDPKAWQSLVHVCRRWRCLVFASPRRLNLRLVCTLGTPVRDMLDIWPALPLLVQGHSLETTSLDNIIAALGHRNRVSGIDLCNLSSSQLTKVLAAMKEPFPELTNLHLGAFDSIAPLDLDLFMGGSTPRLRCLHLGRIPYPRLPNLLLSATGLVSLCLYDSGYISPEAMVTCLSVLTSLKMLCVEFRTFPSRLDWKWQRLPLPTRTVLPSLVFFDFKGIRQYLEDLTSRIDAPRLNYVFVDFIYYELEFDSPQLAQFIGRTPALKAPDEAHVIFGDDACWVRLSSKAFGSGLNVETRWDSEPQLPALAQVCNLSLPPLSTVEDLYIRNDADSRLDWDDPVESDEWLALLKPFTHVKNLYLSDDIKRHIAPALRLLTEDRITEILPTLESIFLEGLLPSGPYEEEIGRTTSPTHPPSFNSHWLRLIHEQDSTAPPPTAQLDWQNFPLPVDGPPQPSGQEDVWQFISPQQPEPQNLNLGRVQPPGPSEEDSEQHSSAQLPTLYNLYSEESQTSRSHEDSEQHSSARPPILQNLYSVESQPSRPFQEDDCPILQNLLLDRSLSSEPFHEDSEQHHSVQPTTLQNPYSVESQPPRPFQEVNWPELQNFQLDWLLPSEPFREYSERNSSAQPPTESQLPRPFQEGDRPGLQNLQLDWSLPLEPFREVSEQLFSPQSPTGTLQSLYSVESQPSIPFQESDWPGLHNLRLDWPLPSVPFHEDSQYSSAQSPTEQSLYSVESQPSIPFREGDWPGLQSLRLDWPLPSEPLHEDSQYSSAQSPTLQSLYSVESQPSIPFQEGDGPDLQNFQLDWSLPSDHFHEQDSSAQPPTLQSLSSVESQPSIPSHEDSQYSSAQSSTVQNIDSEDSQPPGPFREGYLSDPDGSQSSEDFQWEEGFGLFAAARQKITHPITISSWDRKDEVKP